MFKKIFRKPLNESKTGKFLTEKKLGKALLGVADGFTFGGASAFIEPTTTTKSGEFDLTKTVLKLGTIIAVMYFVSKGYLTPEDAKDIVNP